MKFLKPAGTSREMLLEKDAYFIRLFETGKPEIIGLGECSLIPGLSPDNLESFESILRLKCIGLNLGFCKCQALNYRKRAEDEAYC